VPVTKSAVEASLKRAFLAPDAALRVEDAQKVRELVPLLSEVERLLPRRGGLHVVDACSGKSVVGIFIAAHVLATLKAPSRMTAIERDARLAPLFMHAARALEVEAHVSLVTADVTDPAAWPAAPDLVVALHACGAASDAILDQALRVGAKRILLVPCCYGAAPRESDEASAHSAIPGQRAAVQWASALPFPEHALVRRRLAQAFIDAERTLRLEAAGYHTDVVELFAPTASPFHLAWRARLVGEPVRKAEAQRRLDALRAGAPPHS
jgi:predicted RNA methylase